MADTPEPPDGGKKQDEGKDKKGSSKGFGGVVSAVGIFKGRSKFKEGDKVVGKRGLKSMISAGPEPTPESKSGRRLSIENMTLAKGATKKMRKQRHKGEENNGMKASLAVPSASNLESDDGANSSGINQSSEGEASEDGNVKSEHSAFANLIRRRRARKKAESEAEESQKSSGIVKSAETQNITDDNKPSGGGEKPKIEPKKKIVTKKQKTFEASSLFGPEVKSKEAKSKNTTSSSRSSSEPRKRNGKQIILRREASSSALSSYSTDSTDLHSSEGGIQAVLQKADKRKKEVKAGGKMPSDVRDMLLVPGTPKGQSPIRRTLQSPRSPRSPKSLRVPDISVQQQKSKEKGLPEPTVKEKFQEEAKRQAVANYLASPRRTNMVDKALTAIQPAKPPEEDSGAGGFWGAKLKMTDVIVAASAAKAVKMKSKEDVPPPTLDEVAERQCRRLLILCQKSEWESAGETLKALDVLVAQETMDRKVLTETEDRVTGNTPLMYAAIENRISFMERMLALGCNVNKKNKEEYTALHFASMYSREDTVNWLIAKRANPNLKGGPMLQTCVHLACARHSGQSAQIVKILLQASNKEVRLQGDLVNSLPLFTAIENGNSNVCRELLSVQPERQLSQTKQPLNDTPMHLVARRKDATLAKVLIEAGAQVDVQNKEGQTVLHLASIMGDENMVRVLFMARANANLVDSEDRAPIHLAAARGYSKIVEFLVEKFKASIYERTRDGSTLMHIAAINGHPETAMILFDRGVPLLMPNKFGARGIHTAAREGHVGVINSMIKKGEAVDSKTGDNQTALHIAVEVMEFLPAPAGQ